MTEFLLCSNCFKDQGLKLYAFKVGVESRECCRNCGTFDGKKLSKEHVELLGYCFFVRGSFNKTKYGGAPLIQMNEYHYQKSEISVSPWLQEDIKLIEEAAKIGFFHYGPRFWMIGEVEPLKSLQRPTERQEIIQRIISEYPERIFAEGSIFYRLRKNLDNPADSSKYDSPPAALAGKGRLDSPQLSVMYGSQDLEVCIHECRATVDDNLFLATLYPTKDLRLLDLTALIKEQDGVTEFESLDMAVHMLFLAGEHSYEISRSIALAAHEAGFDGLICPSYFSLARTGAIPFDTVYGISVRRLPSYAEYAKSEVIPNIALFGRPLEEGLVRVQCINRLILNKIEYDIQFGPVIHNSI